MIASLCYSYNLSVSVVLRYMKWRRIARRISSLILSPDLLMRSLNGFLCNFARNQQTGTHPGPAASYYHARLVARRCNYWASPGRRARNAWGLVCTSRGSTGTPAHRLVRPRTCGSLTTTHYSRTTAAVTAMLQWVQLITGLGSTNKSGVMHGQADTCTGVSRVLGGYRMCSC